MFISKQKLQTFISLFLTLTKLCHVKHDHLVNFYISLEKSKKLRYLCSSMTDHRKIWHGDAQHVSPVRHPLKSNFKNPRRWTADVLKRPVLHQREILQFFDFQDGGCLPS